MTPRDGVGGYHPGMAWSAHRFLMLLSAALLATVLAGCTREGEPSDTPADAPAEGGLAALPEPFEGVWAGVLGETDVLVSVPHGRPARVAEAHLLVLHCLCDAVDLQLMGELETE